MDYCGQTVVTEPQQCERLLFQRYNADLGKHAMDFSKETVEDVMHFVTFPHSLGSNRAPASLTPIINFAKYFHCFFTTSTNVFQKGNWRKETREEQKTAQRADHFISPGTQQRHYLSVKLLCAVQFLKILVSRCLLCLM